MNRPNPAFGAAATSRKNDLDSLLARAQTSHQSRRFDEAKALYSKILRKHPDQFEALLLLGCCEHDSGASEAGLQLIKRAISIDPRSAMAHCNLGIVLLALGCRQDALACFDKAVALQPTFGDAHYRRGLVLHAQERFEEAISSFDKALKFDPRRFFMFMSKGDTHHALRDLDAAITCYSQAIALNPGFELAWINRGCCLLDQGQCERAIADLEHALALAPGHAVAWTRYAKALTHMGRCDEAYASYEKALSLDADLLDAWIGKADLLLETNADIRLLRTACERALALDPNSVEALILSSWYLAATGQPDTAIEYCDRALAIRPGNEAALSSKVFYLDYSTRTDVAQQQQARGDWWRQVGTPIFEQFGAPHGNDRGTDRKIVLGYVSGDFFHNSPAYSFRPVLENHDRSRFEVICYSTNARRDHITESFMQVADRWRDVASTSDDALANCIRTDKVDILIDLSGHTGNNRLRVFARKPAPVQVTAWGFATGSGVATIDYMFSDPVALPAADRHLYAEQIYDLPSLLIMEPPPADLRRAEPPMVRNGYVTYGLFNRVSKFSDAAVAVWAQILSRDATARLLIKDQACDDELVQRALFERFALHGIVRERISLLGKTSRDDHLKAFGMVDICLDPFPQNGGISTFEALYMGVPVVAKLGQTVASRCGGAIVSAAGLSDWVADDDARYVEIARSVTTERLKELRHALPDMIAERCGPAVYTRAVEEAYRTMWGRHCETAAP